MRPGLFLLLVLSASAMLADPHPKVSDYPVHVASARVDIGAEYMVHTFSNGRQSYLAPEYLVVDTALYPHGPLQINAGRFRLVIDGKSLLPQSPGVVALSLRTSSFDAGGRSQQSSPFPGGAPNGTPGGHPPPVPQAPDPNRPDSPAATETVEEVITRTALPEGEFHSAQGGFLYFAYGGKLKKIKSMQLVYTDESGDLTLPLIP